VWWIDLSKAYNQEGELQKHATVFVGRPACNNKAFLFETHLSEVAMLSPLEEYEYTFALACPAFHHLGSNRRHQSVAKQYPSSQYL